MEQFKLPDEELQYQGFVATEIRKKVNKKALEYEADENADDEGLLNRSVRQKFTRSMPSNNVEGLSESQYKAQW